MTDVGKRYVNDAMAEIMDEEDLDNIRMIMKCDFGNGDVREYDTGPKEPELGKRYNKGKAPLSMILEARHALEGMAGVLAFGADKYARGNWHKGLRHTEVCDSMLRHLSAYLSGEDIDPESGKPHVDHIAINALFLAEGYRTHPELDDRSEELKRV